MYPLDADRPDYEPGAEDTVAARADRSGASPEMVALDHMLSGGGRGMLYVPFLNYAEGSLDAVHEMIVHPDTVPGLSDGGAHVGMICDGSFPTSMLTHWTRDRTRGPRLRVRDVIRMQTHDTARAVGLHDRGVIAEGMRADINVIDYDHLILHSPTVAHDLPAGGRRLVQRADGYAVTMVAGEITYRDGEATGALPGRLLRGVGSSASSLPRSGEGGLAASGREPGWGIGAVRVVSASAARGIVPDGGVSPHPALACRPESALPTSVEGGVQAGAGGGRSSHRLRRASARLGSWLQSMCHLTLGLPMGPAKPVSSDQLFQSGLRPRSRQIASTHSRKGKDMNRSRRSYSVRRSLR